MFTFDLRHELSIAKNYMTQFCLLLLLIAVCIKLTNGNAMALCSTNSVASKSYGSILTATFRMAVYSAVVRSICVHYSQISFTTLSCPEYHCITISITCFGVGRSDHQFGARARFPLQAF